MSNGDLHVHTNVSDGMLSPEEVAHRAVAASLGFISVTDHNSLGGLRRAGQALPQDRVRFISGVELTAQPEDEREIHLLGYGIDPDSEELKEVCREITRCKKEQLREMVRRLQYDGVDVDLPSLSLEDEEGYAGRPLLAQELVSRGVVVDLNQAFGRYLGENARAFVRMSRFEPRRCVEAIHSAGGLVVLAHPSILTVDRWIEPLADLGLDGVEAYRPALRGNAQLYVEKAAAYFHLFVTGGSDWHGRESERPLGAFTVSDEQVSDFLAALPSRRG